MTGATIRFDVAGDDMLERELAALAAAGEDLSAFMDALGLGLVGNTIHRFDRETGPDGVRWTPSGRAKAEGGQTLSKNRDLKGSITYVASADTVEVGTNVHYAAPHQFGATIRAKNGGKLTFKLPGGLGWRSVDEVILPSRPFLGFGPEDEHDSAKEFAEHFGRAAPMMFEGGQP